MSSSLNHVNSRHGVTNHSTSAQLGNGNSNIQKKPTIIEKIRAIFSNSVASERKKTSQALELRNMPVRPLEEVIEHHDDSETPKITPRSWEQIIVQRHVPKDDSPQTPSYLQANAAAKAKELAELLKKINAPKTR